MGPARRSRLKLLAVVLAVGGCQLVVPTSKEQCANDGDCTSRGGPFANSVCVDTLCVPPGDRCLGHVPPVTQNLDTTFRRRLRFTEADGKAPIANVEVYVCPSFSDAVCDISKLTPQYTDATGYLNVQLPKGFHGSVQVLNPPSGYMKTKVHFFEALDKDDPPDQEVPGTGAVRLITRLQLTLQLAAAHVEVDPKAGHIFASAVDCDLVPRAGVTVSLKTNFPGKPIQLYFTANESADIGLMQTAPSGIFGFVNVPQGGVTVESMIPALGKKVASAAFWVNEDTVSTFLLVPTAIP